MDLPRGIDLTTYRTTSGHSDLPRGIDLMTYRTTSGHSDPPRRIDLTTYRTTIGLSTMELRLAPFKCILYNLAMFCPSLKTNF